MSKKKAAVEAVAVVTEAVEAVAVVTEAVEAVAVVTEAVEAVAVVTEAVELSEGQLNYDHLRDARVRCATGLRDGDGLIITYARAISTVCGEGWVYLVGAESKTVRAERALFNLAMGLITGVENKPLRAKCNTYWSRIREAAGYVKSGSASTTLTVDQKTLAELKTMLNRIFEGEAKDACPDSSDIKHYLVDAFTSMGGDMSKIGTKG